MAHQGEICLPHVDVRESITGGLQKRTAITAQILSKVIRQQKCVREPCWTGVGITAVVACEGVNFGRCSSPAHVWQHDQRSSRLLGARPSLPARFCPRGAHV